jgi:hypothetical protein
MFSRPDASAAAPMAVFRRTVRRLMSVLGITGFECTTQLKLAFRVPDLTVRGRALRPSFRIHAVGQRKSQPSRSAKSPMRLSGPEAGLREAMSFGLCHVMYESYLHRGRSFLLDFC